MKDYPTQSPHFQKWKFSEMAAKAKFALVDAKRLETACTEMEDWYKRFSLRANNYKTFIMQSSPSIHQGQ